MTFERVVAPGLVMRQFEHGDAEAIFRAVERNRGHLGEWLPWVARTQSPEDIRSFITRTREQFEENRSPSSGIWLDGELAGCVGSHAVDYENRNCSIGYWLDAARQGQGIMTRCVTVLLDYLFYDLQVHRVEIRCGTGNFRSCAIPERLGFLREGVLRDSQWVANRWLDMVIWSMLEGEWQARVR
jgi:ribosomal-protein-serine acetyltransferase